MIIALINLETDEVLDLRNAPPAEAPLYNAEAQGYDGRLVWRPLSDLELGFLLGQIYALEVIGKGQPA